MPEKTPFLGGKPPFKNWSNQGKLNNRAREPPSTQKIETNPKLGKYAYTNFATLIELPSLPMYQFYSWSGEITPLSLNKTTSDKDI